jgi:YVTN family beta-propeller protein
MRHRLTLIAALAAFALALFAPQALARYAYTGNYDDDTVSVIDTNTNQVVGAPIAVGDGPYSLAATPNGKTVYVANENGEDLTAIDTQSNQVTGSIPLGTQSAVIAISPDGLTAYVTSQTENSVWVVDLQNNQVVGAPIPVGEEPWGVAFTPDGKFAYVTNQGEDSVSVIDTQTRQTVGTPIAVGEGPVNVAFTPDGKIALVANEDEGSVSVIDTQTRQTVGTPIAVSEELWGLAISPDGTRAYVSNYQDDTISVIDVQARQIVGQPIPTGEEPYELALTPDGKTLYAANYEGQSVTAINTQTNQGTEIPVAGGPWQIAIVPDQSPTAQFSFSAGKAASPTAFNGQASSDPDGAVARFDWSFGDGATTLNGGPTPSHVYAKAGGYSAGLTVTDNEGCSTALNFTGRTAYCSGSALAAKTQAITVVAPNNFKFGKLTRNPRNGTAKLRVTVPAAGKLTLQGKKVRATKRGATKAGTLILSIRPKVKLNKALKRRHHATVRIRVTFSPTGGTPRSKGKSLKLIRR